MDRWSKLSIGIGALAIAWSLPSVAIAGEDYHLSKIEINRKERIITQANSSPSQLEQQAQQLYQEENFTEAIPLLQEAIANYEAENNLINQAIAWRNLALIYEKLGQWQQCEKALENSFSLIEKIPDNP